MKEIRPNERLAAIASFIEEGSRVVDVGTDHGFLPIWLVCSGICQNPIAADLRSGPLSQAKRFASEYGVEDSISFRLGDGLAPVSPEEVDTVVIAGMGGETIQDILTAAHWIKDGDFRLILQPQSKIPEIISWLGAEGFYISGARLAEDTGRIYLVLEAVKGDMPPLAPSAYYVPLILVKNSDPLLDRYICGIIKKLENALDGIKRSNTEADKGRAEFMAAALEGLNEIRGGMKK